MSKTSELVELTITLSFGDEIVLHTDNSSAQRFHKRMESFLAGRSNRTDNFKLHSIAGVTILSKHVVMYKATTTKGPVLFRLTPAS